jgi:hypothetical protein
MENGNENKTSKTKQMKEKSGLLCKPENQVNYIKQIFTLTVLIT